MVQATTQSPHGARGTWWRRGGLRLTTAVLILLVLGGYAAVQLLERREAPSCVVRAADGEPLRITPEQAGNAATITAVATARGLPERAVTIALATALQESALKNIEHGDRDSVGLFQQRPSQGWGTVEQILDPVYSANEFYDELVKVPGYSRLPLTVAAQEVQRSGFPQAYAKHETDASMLASALTGRSAAALNCTVRAPDPAAPAGSGGAVEAAGSDSVAAAGSAAKLRELLVREFGEDMSAPEDGEGVPAPEGDAGGADVADGGPVTVLPVRTQDGVDPARRGWALAQWAVAHSEVLDLKSVSFAGRTWSAERSAEGWRGSAADASAREREQVRITVAH